MSYSRITLGLVLAMLGSMIASAAIADNVDVENALKRRPDLSTFYQALINTGVNRELEPGTTYSVFAPTNEALAAIRQDQYPCFYMTECREHVAQILRNHIVPGEIYVSRDARNKGGIYSINNRFVALGEPSRNNFTVDGNNILYTSWFGNGIIYKIDGMIANPRELAGLQYPIYAAYTGAYVGGPEIYYAPAGSVTTTTTERVIADPACGPGGCPDAVSQTTTVTRTVEPTPLLAY